MKTLYKFKVISLMLYLSACGGGGSGGGSDSKTAAPSTPALPITQPSSPGGPSTFPLTYYTLVENKTVSQAGQTYHVTDTGHCVVYTGKNYCWDDGWQKILAINYETDFWGLCTLGGTLGQCSGGAALDPVTQPTLWTQTLIGSMAVPLPPHQPSDVYTQGIATPVTCQITGTIVDCVDFQIDTSTASL